MNAMDDPASRPPLGGILAGGSSRRFGGEPKALARIGGRRIIERVRDALEAVSSRAVLLTGDPEPYQYLGLPTRPDRFPGAGPLGGIHAALLWAAEEDRPGALCVASDMPFLRPALLRAILDRASAGAVSAVAPESRGPRGVEPLCAYYAIECIDAIEGRLHARDVELSGLLVDIDAKLLPLSEVEKIADPDVMFFNVNDPDDLGRARAIDE